jgi:hypothetical protein
MTDQEKSYGKAALVTALLGGLYVALHHLPLPAVAQAFSFAPDLIGKHMAQFNILALGLTPVLSGFICLEVLSLILPPLNRWRLQGVPGRAKLNRWAWYLSLVFCSIQAWGTSYLLENLMGSQLPSPVLLYRIQAVAALMGGTALSVLLARFITEHGIGNGFLILLLARDIPYYLISLVRNYGDFLMTQPVGEQQFVILVMAAGFVLASVLLWKFMRRVPRVPFRTQAGKLGWFEVPAFPAGGSLHGFCLTWISSTAALLGYFHLPEHWMRYGMSHLGLELGVMAVMGFLFYNWFWGGVDLFGGQVGNMPKTLQKRERFLDRHFYRSMGLLLGGVALFYVPLGPKNFSSLNSILNLGALIWYYALFQDLWAYWGFWKAHGQGVVLMELDNMILASYLKGLMEAEGVPHHFQSFRLRQLMLWIKPLYKVRLLVPAEHVERAQALIASVPYQVV